MHAWNVACTYKLTNCKTKKRHNLAKMNCIVLVNYFNRRPTHEHLLCKQFTKINFACRCMLIIICCKIARGKVAAKKCDIYETKLRKEFYVFFLSGKIARAKLARCYRNFWFVTSGKIARVYIWKKKALWKWTFWKHWNRLTKFWRNTNI